MNQIPTVLPAFIWHFLKPHKYMAFAFITIAALTAFWGPCNSMLIKYVINLLPTLHHTDRSPLIWPAALIVINFIVFDNITWRSIGYIKYRFKGVIKNKIISDMLELVLGKSQESFQDNFAGRISNQIITLADTIELILYAQSPDFIKGISLLLICFVTVYQINSLFFHILFFWLILFFITSFYMSKRLTTLAANHTQAESLVSGQLVDCITNHYNIRIFSRKDYEINRLNPFLAKTRTTQQKQDFFFLLLNSTQGFLIAVMLGFIVYFLVYLSSQKLITPGDFVLILGISIELGHTMWYIMWQFDQCNQAIGRCKRNLKELMEKAEFHTKGTKELVVSKGHLEFKNVTFNYKDTQFSFHISSLTIKGGEKVGLVGYSGAGKSTFVNLILRLYEIHQGHILIDGQDIQDVMQEGLRRAIAVIPQDPSLFHRSLMENIRYGTLKATDEEAIEAAEQAYAHEFISTLDQSYNTLVGERGIKLSGGQRQRIAIARAILKNAPILILDEATSQLDSVSERYIQSSLWHLMHNKTTIVIAHRLSTLLHMDRIIVFDQGRIVEDGTHTELLSNNKLYTRLWNAQIDGFLPDKNYQTPTNTINSKK